MVVGLKFWRIRKDILDGKVITVDDEKYLTELKHKTWFEYQCMSSLADKVYLIPSVTMDVVGCIYDDIQLKLKWYRLFTDTLNLYYENVYNR